MSLRVIATWVISLLLLLALGTAGLLISLTTRQRLIANSLAAAIDAVHAVEEFQADLLAHSREIRVPRTEHPASTEPVSEEDLQRRLVQIQQDIGSPEEAARIEDVRGKLALYLQAQHAATTSGENRAKVDEALARRDATYASLERLVEINVQQSRAAEASAAHADYIANAGGIAAAGILAAAAAGLLVWIWGFALRPVFELAGAMEGFASGNRSSRAAELGARETREMARRFNEMADALQRERENQLTFLSSVAHDLRNPLSALRMSAALSSRDGPELSPEQVRRTLSLVGRQVDSLERMVGDLLDATRIEAGKLELRIEDRDARALTREVIEVYWASARRPIELELGDEALPIRCDPTRIGQVLHNLVSNAIKYSPDSSPIHVRVGREARDAVFAVLDHGIGIRPEELPRIFEPFRRSGEARHVAAGVGLGLSVARRIVQAHDGRIEVQSTPGEGSIFRVRIPITVVHAARQTPARSQPLRQPATEPRSSA